MRAQDLGDLGAGELGGQVLTGSEHLSHLGPGQEHAHGANFVLVYRARITDGELAAGDDADRVAFFEREHLPTLAFRATRQILQLDQQI